MKTFTYLTILFVAILSLAADARFDLATSTKSVDQFLNDHEATESKIYCRTDIAVQECRSIIFFKNKADGRVSDSFQIAFFAPSRQVAGTELFIKEERGSRYARFADSKFNGKFVPEDTGQEFLPITKSGSRINIRGIKFGSLTANITIDDRKILLDGTQDTESGRQRVNVEYERFQK
ncbi:MAG: hypothetical protein M9962_08475 [Oligoflexia bacterium]|nr:hypothetical protein [Oligoflexia bacterium]